MRAEETAIDSKCDECKTCKCNNVTIVRDGLQDATACEENSRALEHCVGKTCWKGSLRE